MSCSPPALYTSCGCWGIVGPLLTDFFLWVSWISPCFWFLCGRIRCLEKLNYPCRFYHLLKYISQNKPKVHKCSLWCWLMGFPFLLALGLVLWDWLSWKALFEMWLRWAGAMLSGSPQGPMFCCLSPRWVRQFLC